MPTPKKMTGEKATATAPAKPVATPPKPPAKPTAPAPAPTRPVPPQGGSGTAPAGLVKSNAATPATVPIPGFLQKVSHPQTSNRQQTGYVGFASSQSKKWNMMQQAGLEEGQPFLYHQNAYIPLVILDFFLCRGASYQTMMAGKEGTFIYATTDMDLSVEDRIYKGQVVKLEPHYVCLILVALNGNLIPIKGDFRGTKSGGIENAIRAVEAAEEPDWLKLSDAHKATAAFPEPWGRVFHRITTKRGVSKSNGNPYFSANCNSAPASVTQMQLLVNALKDEQFNNVLTEANKNYEGRIDFMNGIVEKGTDILEGRDGEGNRTGGDPVPF